MNTKLELIVPMGDQFNCSVWIRLIPSEGCTKEEWAAQYSGGSGEITILSETASKFSLQKLIEIALKTIPA